MNLEPKMAKRFASLMLHCPAQSVVRGMVRMAEDVADEGDLHVAGLIWQTAIELLELRNEYMYLAKLIGDGNKMIGIAPDEQKRDAYIQKSLEAA